MTKKQSVVLVAASGLAREVVASIERGDSHEVVGVLDDNSALHGQSLGSTEIIGGIDRATAFGSAAFLICAGSGTARSLIVRRLADLRIGADRFTSVIDPSAVLGTSCQVGRGTIVLAQVTATADVSIGRHVVLMPNVVLTHDDLIGDFATLCAGVALGGAVKVGSGAYLGMNSSVRQNVTIGDSAVLGMGSVALSNIPAAETWIGVPARLMEAGSRTANAILRATGVAS